MEFKWYYNESLTHFEFHCTLNQKVISHVENVLLSHSTTKIGMLSNKKSTGGRYSSRRSNKYHDGICSFGRSGSAAQPLNLSRVQGLKLIV